MATLTLYRAYKRATARLMLELAPVPNGRERGGRSDIRYELLYEAPSPIPHPHRTFSAQSSHALKKYS